MSIYLKGSNETSIHTDPPETDNVTPPSITFKEIRTGIISRSTRREERGEWYKTEISLEVFISRPVWVSSFSCSHWLIRDKWEGRCLKWNRCVLYFKTIQYCDSKTSIENTITELIMFKYLSLVFLRLYHSIFLPLGVIPHVL